MGLLEGGVEGASGGRLEGGALGLVDGLAVGVLELLVGVSVGPVVVRATVGSPVCASVGWLDAF